MTLTIRIHYYTHWGQRLFIAGPLADHSSINHEGKGIPLHYLGAGSWGITLDIPEGKAIPPLDVMIPVVDTEMHRTMMRHYKRLSRTMGTHIRAQHGGFAPPPGQGSSMAFADIKIPKWLMEQYYWDCSMTHNYYDAEKIDSVVPGLGMLANSHPGMILAENIGPQRPKVLGGVQSSKSTPYQDQSFIALEDIAAGHEIFVEVSGKCGCMHPMKGRRKFIRQLSFSHVVCG